MNQIMTFTIRILGIRAKSQIGVLQHGWRAVMVLILLYICSVVKCISIGSLPYVFVELLSLLLNLSC